MKIAICDDRKSDRSALKALLEAYGQDFEIREYGSGKSLCGDMDYIRECGRNSLQRLLYCDLMLFETVYHDKRGYNSVTF